MSSETEIERDAGASEPVRVLHVDDEPDLAELAASFLTREDDRFEIETATSAAEGLDRLDEHPVDCVVSDYEMPGKNGIEFLEAVRECHKDLPFILYTGKGGEEVASDAISAGVTDYLQKQSSTDHYKLLANRIANAVDQYRAEQSVERTRRRFQTLVEEATDAILVVGPDADITFATPSAESVLGRTPEELVGTNGFEPVHSEDTKQVVETFAALIESPGERRTVEFRYRKPDGSWIWAEARGRNLLDEPVVDGIVVYTRDITERKERELELEQYEAYLQESTDIVTVLDESGEIKYESPSVTRILGYEPGELIGQDGFEFVHSDDVDKAWSAFSDLVTEPKSTTTVEFRFRTVDGEWRWLEVRGTNQLDHPAINGIVTNNRDITERKKRERELERTSDLLDRTERIADVGGWEIDTESMAVFWTDHLFDILGRDYDGEPHLDEVLDVYHEADRPVVESAVEQALEDGESFDVEARIHRPDGEVRWLRIQGRPTVVDGEVTTLRGAVQDVTERKARERRLTALNETARDLMVADSRQQVVEVGVEAAREILDLDANAIHLYDEAQSALVPAAVTAAGYELVGEPPAFTAGNSIAWRAYERDEALALNDVQDDPDRFNPDTPVRSELLLPIGEYGILVAGSDAPESFAQADRILGEILTGTIEAALEQVERTEELHARERELTRQNERLEEFTSVVSHDLRNPLQVAAGRLELARAEHDSDHLEAVADALDRMDGLIGDLLALAREGEQGSDREPVDLRALVRSCWRTVETGDATVDVATDRVVRADRGRLAQLLENLLRNAVEHADQDDGEGVTITVGDLDDGFFVADDGPGIPESDRDRVFEVGYSTAASGTGFGLRIVRQAAEAHDWDVRLTESAGGGARFEIVGITFVDE